jgi:hypothetical protein
LLIAQLKLLFKSVILFSSTQKIELNKSVKNHFELSLKSGFEDQEEEGGLFVLSPFKTSVAQSRESQYK